MRNQSFLILLLAAVAVVAVSCNKSGKSKSIAGDGQVHGVAPTAKSSMTRPFGMTFMFVTNASTQQYLYFTDNVEHCTGLKKEDLYKGGVPFVLSRVHPDDRKLWTESVGMLYNELLKLPKEKRLKTNMQFNYRFLHQNNSYINIEIGRAHV